MPAAATWDAAARDTTSHRRCSLLGTPTLWLGTPPAAATAPEVGTPLQPPMPPALDAPTPRADGIGSSQQPAGRSLARFLY